MQREVCEAEGSGMVLALGVATRQEDQFLSRVVGECRSGKNDITYIIGRMTAVRYRPGLAVVDHLAFKEDQNGDVGRLGV